MDDMDRAWTKNGQRARPSFRNKNPSSMPCPCPVHIVHYIHGCPFFRFGFEFYVSFANVTGDIIVGYVIMKKQLLAILVIMSSFCSKVHSNEQLKIVTIDSPLADILHQKTVDFSEDELPLAQEIADKLINALKPYMPAAGLAAPQIGINRSIFIYSYDRDPKHLEVVINPMFEPIGNDLIIGWEGCLSVMCDGNWMLAQLPRFAKIQVSYLNLKGEKIERIFDGFAAKVFQHEYDHLQGMECINHPEAIVKSFPSKKELESFLQAVKEEDAKRYNQPT